MIEMHFIGILMPNNMDLLKGADFLIVHGMVYRPFLSITMVF
jgi:hypothetical protein